MHGAFPLGEGKAGEESWIRYYTLLRQLNALDVLDWQGWGTFSLKSICFYMETETLKQYSLTVFQNYVRLGDEITVILYIQY